MLDRLFPCLARLNQLDLVGDPSVAGRIAAYEDAMDLLLNPEKRDEQASIQRTADVVQLPVSSGGATLPAGKPIAQFANIDPIRGANLCPDLLENQDATSEQSFPRMCSRTS
jgi:hypothetical protein